MIDRLKFDLANQHRYIINQSNLNISLTRTPDNFCLLYTKTGAATDPSLNPKVKILDASLYVRKHTVYPSLSISHQKLLDSGQNARYPIKK
jgi:hypothetical protein